MLKHELLKPRIQMSDGELADVYLKARCDYHFFLEQILGYTDMNDEHFELAKFLQYNPKKFKLIMMPRYTFKSCIITQGGSLWDAIRNPNIRVLIYSDAAGKAQSFLQGIKNHVEGKAGGSRFREFYPGWEVNPHKEKWNESQAIFSIRNQAHVEPSVDTGGIETSKVGMHYDKIYFDDIVSDINVTTKAQMDKVHECYKKSLSLLKPGGDIIVTGTRWHFNDAYGRILEDNKERDLFGVFIRKAVVGDKFIFANTGPNALTEEFLDRQKKEQGSYVFSCLYQNEPVSNEAALFKEQDFQFYGELKKSSNPHAEGLYENMYITGTLDPAGEGDDGTAGTIVGTDASLRLYVIELMNQTSMSPSQMIEWIIKMNRKYHLRKFGLETTFFRGMLKRQLEERLRDERETNSLFHSFSVEEFKTRWRQGEGKRLRIESMQPLHERGDILFPEKSIESSKGLFSNLIYQMMQTTHDHIPEPNDLLDAFSWQMDLVQRGGMPEIAGPPINTPAWLEQEWVDKHNRMQKRLPRRARRTYECSLS